MVKWNNRVITVLLLACIAGGAYLLYAATPIVDSLGHLTNTMVSEVRFSEPKAEDILVLSPEHAFSR
jgi:hypothetical protein